MTIALVAYYLGPRLGIGQYLDRLLPPLVASLVAQGIQPTILSSPNALSNTPALQQLSNYVEVVPELDYAPGRRYFWLATQFHRYCQKMGLELVVWLSNPVLLPWHPPTIAVIHDVNEWKAKDKYGSRLKTALRSLIYLDASIRFSKQIIAVSQATQTDLRHFRPQLNPEHHPKNNAKHQRPSKLKVISNGADSSLSSLPPAQLPTASGPFLLSVGRIDPAAKRLPEALEIVKALRKQSHQPWELQLVGGMNSSTQAEGEAFLKSVEALPWVHYQGHIDDRTLAQWYREAAAVVYLSESEGFGLPIAEAASFQKWVVVNDLNQAAVEVGEGAIIPISTQDPTGAAAKITAQLAQQAQATPSRSLPTWSAAAQQYATDIKYWHTQLHNPA